MTTYTRSFVWGAVALASFLSPLMAEEWPRWRGVRGDGTWQAPGNLPEVFPDDGLPTVWQHKLGGGYAGVTVANDRVYTMDRNETDKTEGVLCWQADSGELLWQHRYPADYSGLDYNSGPRASVTIHDGRAYTLGAVGHAFCFDAITGEVLWKHDTVADFDAERPYWGFAGVPFIYGPNVIFHIGAKPNGCYVAFDCVTGEEKWRSLSDPPGYCTPIVVEVDEQEQLIAWTPQSIHGLNPGTGEVLWSIPFEVKNGVSIATPVVRDDTLFIHEYWDGTKAIALDQHEGKSRARISWESMELCGLMAQPIFLGGHGYLLDRSRGLSCFAIDTGEVKWKDEEHRIMPTDRHPQSTIVNIMGTDRALVLNSNGELIQLRLSPEGFEELSRCQLIDRTWAHPAYANDRIYARSDRQIICAQLLPSEAQ